MATETMTTPAERREVIEVGAISGAAAGALMALVSMVGSYFLQQGFWFPIRLIGTMFYGVSGLLRGPEVVAIGIIIHLLVSTFFGIIFSAFMTRSTEITTALINGIFYGAVIWAFMTFLTLPIFNPVMWARVTLSPVPWFIAHLFYGATLAMIPWARRRLFR